MVSKALLPQALLLPPLSQISPGRRERGGGGGNGRYPHRLGVFVICGPQGECDMVCSILKLAICCSLGGVSSAGPFVGRAFELGSEPQGNLGLRKVSCSGSRGIRTANSGCVLEPSGACSHAD